jgi:hypothetical protein
VSGYRRSRTVKLTWAGGEFAGLEIRVRRISVRRYLDLAPLLDGQLDTDTEDGRKAALELLSEFGSLIRSWNLQDEDGEPVPCTAEAFLDQDPTFVREVLDQWAAAVAGVSAPLETPSSAGAPFPEGSIPMDVLSPSPQS